MMKYLFRPVCKKKKSAIQQMQMHAYFLFIPRVDFDAMYDIIELIFLLIPLFWTASVHFWLVGSNYFEGVEGEVWDIEERDK